MEKCLNQDIQQLKKLEGQTIQVDNALNNLNFIRESKRLAEEHEWLYHCTTDVALISILKNKELWLSNLKLVNDAEEADRVDVPEYERTYYICCFTYDPEIPEQHWKEYGNMENGVLIGIKPDWVKREATFLCGDKNQKCKSKFEIIFNTERNALEYIIEQQQKGYIVNPFYINAFNFYQVIYDDKLKKNIQGNASMIIGNEKFYGRSLTPEVAGIIKSTKGICKRFGRTPYEKDWTTEKEVRLKVGIQQYDIFKNGYEIHDNIIMPDVFFPKIAVPLNENAFKTIKIRFSPNFHDKEKFIENITSLLPENRIDIF